MDTERSRGSGRFYEEEKKDVVYSFQHCTLGHCIRLHERRLMLPESRATKPVLDTHERCIGSVESGPGSMRVGINECVACYCDYAKTESVSLN